MKKFERIEGVAAPLPEADINTDVLFPARFLLLLQKNGLGKHLFHERRYRLSGELTDFVLNRPPFDTAKILVADENFGSGSSREHAVWALADFGIRCVIALSFGEIFFGNCFRNGVLPITLDREPLSQVMQSAESGKQLVVDLTTQTIHLPNGAQLVFDIDPSRRRALLLGLDEIGAILADDAGDIEAFEEVQRRKAPWLQLNAPSASVSRRHGTYR
jgi:3-isopropylmalate/(R)-2-methylmalate dehydratase small subunit